MYLDLVNKYAYKEEEKLKKDNNENIKRAFKKSMKKNKGNRLGQIITIIIFAIIGLVVYFGNGIPNNTNLASNKGDVQETTGVMEVHYLDVGQGDSAYIKVNNYDILIDAGDNGKEELLLSQLKEFNIDDFEVIIATHPHADHIGGMAEVLRDYKVESFYMPKVSHTTKTYENMIKAIEKQGIKIKPIKEGTTLDFGGGAFMKVYSPIYEKYENLNDYSPIMKFTFGESDFIFTGDAEYHSEEEVVLKYPNDLKAEVLKFGHHGSRTSSTTSFVESVNPDYGIISCGLNNDYGHPHRETLDKITKYEIESYRTDKQGQITLVSDGKTISVKTEK